jgi:transcriptional regulator with PAS, ATPase and Fis domain
MINEEGNMEPKVGMICYDTGLQEEAKKAAYKRNIHIEIRTGTLEAAIPIAKQLEAEGVDAIICLVGTADILRKNLSVPVIEIQDVSTFDLVENVSHAIGFGKNIGICVYGNPIAGMDVVERLLQVKIKQIVYQDSESLLAAILSEKEEGIDVCIGRKLTSEICRKIGMPSVFLGISEERVVNAISEAIRIACVSRNEREKTKHIDAMLDSVSEGMIAIDRNGKINIFNRVAKEILGVKDAVGKYIDELGFQLGLREVLETGTPKLQRLQKIGDIQIISNLEPVHLDKEVIGVIASFSDVSQLIQAEQNVRRSFTKGFVATYTVDDIVCKSLSMKRIILQARQFASSDSTVLITGESGTGKELVAQSIHNLSSRRKGPFVAINCSALPENLLESELFGYEEGAFTGAKKGGKPGLFELAHQGSIFLDEIGAIPLVVQSRLLRAIQQKEVMRIGGDRIIPVDVRIITATNVDLLRTVKQGRMRMDLYFRINILRIHIPPLRERKEDIPVLLKSLLKRHTQKYGKQMEQLPEELLERLVAHSWPGNVRELDNFIEKYIIMIDTPDQYKEVLDLLFEECLIAERVLFEPDEAGSVSLEEQKNPSADFYKKKAIAKMMGISRTTLWRKLKAMDKAHQ